MSHDSVTKNTTLLLQKLRRLMKNSSINAYILPSGDAHMSEYIALCDARRAFISGFTGSYGVAVVTESKAALWTDGRYFLQATQQMDDNWILMKMGLSTTPSKDKWLIDELPPNGKVGVDPYLISQCAWEELSKKLEQNGHSLVPVRSNLIDEIWEGKQLRPLERVFVHKLEFAGSPWQEKVTLIRTKMEENKCSALVVSALDEVAWMLNLRGSDIPFNPVFFSYLIITMDTILLFIDKRKLNDEVRSHLNVSGGENEMKVNIKPYEGIIDELNIIVQNSSGKTWVFPNTNQAIAEIVPKDKLLKEHSPVSIMKSVKNDAEIRGMKSCHVRDGVALCQFLSWLEKDISRISITEIEAADYLESCRKKQKHFVGLSFKTISSTGADGAIIHYTPSPETDKVISANEVYLVDSGAQYLDGTTDITRTVHLGTPTDYEKECFTSVLKSHIAMDMAVFPNGIKGIFLDSIARQHLWNLGLDYRHGTGHGVGSFLNIREGPIGISQKIRSEDIPLKKGMVLSNEPGYYEEGKFGMRIENIFIVVEAQTKHNYQGVRFLTCETISFVPIQTKLINKSLLTQSEIDWLNRYNKKCRDIVGAEVQKQGLDEVYRWMMKETQPL